MHRLTGIVKLGPCSPKTVTIFRYPNASSALAGRAAKRRSTTEGVAKSIARPCITGACNTLDT